MENVKQNSQGGSPLLPLLQQLLIELLRNKDYKVRDVESALRKLEAILSSKKALVVLDDLDQSSYLELPVRICKMFSDGSRVIITTRDANLPNQLEVEMSKVDTYWVKHLNGIDSLELFSYHAFKQPKPPRNYISLSKSFVNHAGGLPLALKVLGSSLCGRKDVSFWKAKLEKIQKIPVKDIQKVLQLSYDELDDETEKAIFLDIVFFFLGNNRDEAVDVFNSCDFFPETGITILVERCLLTIDSDNRLQMHNLIQDMGRNVIREESKHAPCQRLYWDHEEACQASQNPREMDKIEGLIIDLTRSTNKYCNADIFERLTNLRLLKLIDVHDIKGNFRTSFHKLRCISWHGCLRIIELVFTGCKLTYVPHSIRNLTSLRNLYLDHKDIRRIELADAANNMKLEVLIMSCNIRVWLPMILSFSSLKQLTLYDECGSLSPTIPFSFFKLSCLEELALISCTGHGSSFPELPLNLNTLVVRNHASLEQVPDLSHLRLLEELEITNCSSLQSLQKLPPNLSGLEICECAGLQDLPDLSMLRNLRSLKVERNSCSLKVNLKNSHLQVGRDKWSEFRANLQNREIAEWFDYKNSGCTVSFDIPPNLGDNFVGVAFWVVIKSNIGILRSDIVAVITNKTEGMTYKYCMEPGNCVGGNVPSFVECVRGDVISIKSGDKVQVSFRADDYADKVALKQIQVKMCGAHVILKN